MKIEMYKKEIIISEVNIPILEKIIEKDKVLGHKLCLYVFLTKDLSKDNPIATMSYLEKESQAKSIVFNNADYKFDDDILPEVILAQEYYYKNFVDKTDKLLETYNNKMDQFNTLLSDPKNAPKIIKNESEKDGSISYASNIKIINSIMNDVLNIIVNKSTVQSLQNGEEIILRNKISPLENNKLKL